MSQTELAELNTLLNEQQLDLPSLRRVVTVEGDGNYRWLQRNILIRNKSPNPRLLQLLKMRIL